jgi:hypothetical protein
MTQRTQCIPPLRELVDGELTCEEAERLARVDALLRAARPPLRLAETAAYDLKLTYRELSLVYRSLQAARTLGALADDQLFDDTIGSVDRALRAALR